eukprot:4277744-Pyramimonas_sp.AAC.1
MDAGFRHFRVELVDEPPSVVAGILDQYRRLGTGEQQVRVMGISVVGIGVAVVMLPSSTNTASSWSPK